MACFDAASHTVGSTWTLNYAQSGSVTGTTRTTNTVARQTTFNGFSAYELVTASTSTITAPAAGVSASDVKIYRGAPTATGIMQYGSIVTNGLTSPSGVTSVVTSTYTPPWEGGHMYLLSAGQSDTVIYTSSDTSQTTIPGSPSPPATTTNTTYTRVVKYVGQETVTVPAGTFTNACRFETTTTPTSGSATFTTSWVTSGGSGVSVKTVSGSTGNAAVATQDLTSGTFNGVAVR